MREYESYIHELENLSTLLDLYYIKYWLFKYEEIYKEALFKSKCGKWLRLILIKEQPYPCCCPLKEIDCLFIELYYNLKKLIKADYPDSFYINNIIKRALNSFKNTKDI